MPIDFLLSSMAAELGSRAIGVVLSGVGSDGALGLKAIKQANGFAVAQGSNGSRPWHGEMPAAAIAATTVDLIVPVEKMAERIAKLPLDLPQSPTADDSDDDENSTAGGARADHGSDAVDLRAAAGAVGPRFLRLQATDLPAAGAAAHAGRSASTRRGLRRAPAPGPAGGRGCCSATC